MCDVCVCEFGFQFHFLYVILLELQIGKFAFIAISLRIQIESVVGKVENWLMSKIVTSGPVTEHNQAKLQCLQMNISCGRSEQISMVAEIQARGSNTLLQLEIVQISDWRMYITTEVSRPAIYRAFFLPHV